MPPQMAGGAESPWSWRGVPVPVKVFRIALVPVAFVSVMGVVVHQVVDMLARVYRPGMAAAGTVRVLARTLVRYVLLGRPRDSYPCHTASVLQHHPQPLLVLLARETQHIEPRNPRH
jgi:hypothetical protein